MATSTVSYPTSRGLPITSPYGWRYSPISGELEFHAGIDISGNGEHHPVYAVQTGTVLVNQWSETGGWMVYIQHIEDHYYSRYLHLKEQSPIPAGAMVTSGQQIGIMGSTGESTGIHLHLEIATSNSGWGTEAGTIDPVPYLQGSQDGGGGHQPPGDIEKLFVIRRHNTNMRRDWRRR